MDGVTSKAPRTSARSVRKGGKSNRSKSRTADQQAIEERVEETDNLAETSSSRATESTSPPAKISKKIRQSKKSPLTEVQQSAKDASGLRSGKWSADSSCRISS